jgi:hypothetical protein
MKKYTFFLLFICFFLNSQSLLAVEFSVCKEFKKEVKKLTEKISEPLRNLDFIEEKDFCRVNLEIGGEYLKKSEYTFSYEGAFSLELRILANKEIALKEHSFVTKINKNVGKDEYYSDLLKFTNVFLLNENARLWYRVKQKGKAVNQYPEIINLAKKLIGITE